jgi:hypothetical protein
MNKNELVHVHSLLSLVARTYIEEGVATPDDFAAYRALETTPMALRRSREDHAAATRTLARALARRASGQPVEANEVGRLVEQ